MTWFAEQILNWSRENGRKDLPWQSNPTPYSVWISEVMLQQTQVETVKPYFIRFMTEFPTVQSLAAATEDEVLSLWSGLGYYRRAKNLYKAAHEIDTKFQGSLPEDLDLLSSLPGIGRSTAGAILALGFRQRGLVLDGNVKRVMARYSAVDGDPNRSKVLKRLWKLVDEQTPANRCADYVQAIMDLGATCCTKSNPNCEQCPLSSRCIAHQTNSVAKYPAQQRRTKVETMRLALVLAVDSKRNYLLKQQRNSGLWASLYLPLIRAPKESVVEVLEQANLDKNRIKESIALKPFSYSLSHRQLQVTTDLVKVDLCFDAHALESDFLSYATHSDAKIGLPQFTLQVIEQAEENALIDHLP